MKKYEIGNNDVQEVLNTPPKFFVFWGTSIIAILFVLIGYFLINYSFTIKNSSLYNHIEFRGLNEKKEISLMLTVNPDDIKTLLLSESVELTIDEKHFAGYKIEINKIHNKNGKLYVKLSPKTVKYNQAFKHIKKKAHVNLILQITLLDYLIN